MIRGLKKSFVIFICLITVFCSASATVINQDGVPIKTNTDIVINGNVTNIQTNTTVNGNIGVNTFGKFNVSKGDIVNLNLINGQNKLVNLIYDSSPSQINGIVNSYMNGKIGGNILFANPNGFVIGADGVFNVGSLTLMTPTQQSMDSLINSADPMNLAFNETQVNKLVSFSFNGDNYLVGGDITDPIRLAPSLIEVSGKINSAGGVDLITGGTVDVKSGAQLNANVEFQYDENNFYTIEYQAGEDVITEQLSIVENTTPKSGVTPSGSSTFAMSDGNGIVIVASNDGTSNDYLGAIVNLNGNINANGSNVIVRTEIDNTVSGATSQIDMNAILSANELTLSAKDGSISSVGADFTVDSLKVLAGDSITLVNEGDINIATLSSENNGAVVLTSNQGSIKTQDTNYLLKADSLTLTAKNGAVDITKIEGNGVTIDSKTADVADLKSGETLITTTGETKLGTATVDSIILNAGSADITSLTSTNAGELTAGSLTLGTGSFSTVTINADTADITSLTSGTSTISSTGGVKLGTGNITGDLLVTKSTEFTSDTKLTVTGETNINSSGSVTLNDTDLQKLTINSAASEITTLTSGETTITTSGLATIETATVDSIVLNAGSADITSLTSTNAGELTAGSLTLGTGSFSTVTINADTADITSLTSGETSITTTGDTKLESSNITAKAVITSTGGNISLGETTVSDTLTANAKKDLTINGHTNVSGETLLSAGENLVFAESKQIIFNNDLTIQKTGNVDLDSLTVNGDAYIDAKKIDIAAFIVNKDSYGNKGNAIIKSTGETNIKNATIANDLETNASNLNITEKLVVGGTANLGSDKNIYIKDTDINILDTKGATNVTIDNLKVTQDGTIIAKGDVVLTKTNVGGDFKIESKNLTLNDATIVTGTTSFKATEKLTFVPDDVTFNNDLIIEKGTGMVEVNHLTVNGNAELNSNGATNIVTAVINGDLKTDASVLNITEKLTVTGTANLGSKTNINIKDTDINILDTEGATNVTIENLNVKENARLIAKGDVVIDTTTVGKDLTIESKNLTLNKTTSVEGHTSLKATDTLTFVPTDVTFDTLTIEKGTGTVNINHLTITEWAEINSSGKTTINKADVTGDLTTDTKILEVNNLTVTGGDTLLRSSELITIHEAQLDNLTTEANNMTIDNMTVEGIININNTGNLNVTDMLTAHDVVNMRSDASINIKDAVMDKDLNLNSKNAVIQEINLVGNMNGNVDKLTVNTSNVLNIGYIAGKSKSYATSTNITTPKTVVNGLGEDYSKEDINIYGKDITIDAAEQIASPDKQLNFKLAKGNNIRLFSEGTIDVFTTGAIGNYRNIVTDNLNIKTDSDGINIYRAIVTTYGDIRLAGKHIIIDNTTWKPNLYVTLQLRSITSPHYLFVNGSPFITTQSLNALRHGMNIYVNRTKDATSMNSWLTSSMEAQLKTSNVAEKFYDKTDKNLNTWATLNSYVADNFNNDSYKSIIETVKGEIITPDNVDELINSNPNSIKKQRRLFKRKQQSVMEISYR